MQNKITKKHSYQSLSKEALYNHFSYQIELFKYGSSFKSDLIATLPIDSISTINQSEFEIMMHIHSILWHEFTHFLDHSTTLWGHEYNIRTLNLYEAINKRQPSYDVEKKYEVFCLNLAEEKLHHLIKKYEHSTGHYVVGYRLNYNPDLGVFAQYSLYDKSSAYKDEIFNIDLATPICEIPLSMLVIIEANAYTQEVLFKYNTIQRYGIDIKTHCAKLQREVEQHINNCEMSEYTILIRHTKQVFPALDFIKILEIVSTVARFVLNMPVALFGMINNFYIKNIFKVEEEYVQFLLHDHARGSSRASFFLMFIQWLASDHENSTDFNIDEELNRMLVVITENRLSLESVQKMYEMELEWAQEFLCNITYPNPLKSIGKTNIKQAHLYKNFEFDFSKLMLPEFIMNDGETVQMPNPLSFDYNEYTTFIDNEYFTVGTLIKKGIKKRPNIAELGINMFQLNEAFAIPPAKQYNTRTQKRHAQRLFSKKNKFT